VTVWARDPLVLPAPGPAVDPGGDDELAAARQRREDAEDTAATARAQQAGSSGGEPDPAPRLPLRFLSVADLRQAVADRGTPTWLFRGLWPGDAYGVVAAEDKVGKTWAAVDAAISVASGTAWLGRFPADSPGPALLLAGEGGERGILRRLDAVATSRGLRLDDLPVRVLLRVPHLTNAVHMEQVAQELADHPARHVTLDPLYLAARGASGSDLYAMGEHLETLQHITQAAGSALTVVTHFNKTGEGRGSKRITGAGPGAWGRVLVTGTVDDSSTDPNTGASTVDVTWEAIGGEIPATSFGVRRRVWTDDPNDLASPMHYEITELAASEDDPGARPRRGATATDRVRDVMSAATGAMTVQQIGDALAANGRPMKARTIQDALAALRTDYTVLDGRGTRSYLPTGHEPIPGVQA